MESKLHKRVLFILPILALEIELRRGDRNLQLHGSLELFHGYLQEEPGPSLGYSLSLNTGSRPPLGNNTGEIQYCWVNQ